MNKVFNITNEYIELNKLLKVAGWCSTGGQANIAIDNEQVFVNGNIETRKRRKLKNGMTVKYDNHCIKVVGGKE